MGDLPDFISQLPPVLFLPICFPAVLLIIYVTYAAYIRPERRKKQALMQAENTVQAPAAATPAPVSAPAGPSALDLLYERSENRAPARRIDTGDLPDLDLLLAAAEATPTPTPVQTPPDDGRVQLHTGLSTRATEALRILRDETDGRLMVQIDGLAYRSLIDSPEAKKEFTRIMKELSSIILEPDSAATANAAAQAPRATTPKASAEVSTEAAMESPAAAAETPAAAIPAPAEPDADSPVPEAPPAATPPAAAKPSSFPPGERLPGDLPSYRYDDNPAIIKSRTLRGPKVEFEAPPAVDIASAIETYLQFKLERTDDFRGRSIHIRPSLSGGVRIEVDGQYFEAVDDVSDAAVRDFLKQSIQEWQDRQ